MARLGGAVQNAFLSSFPKLVLHRLSLKKYIGAVRWSLQHCSLKHL